MRVEACSIGQAAAHALRKTDKAEVIASFDQSFYLEAGSQIICVASNNLYDGPLNLLTRTRSRLPAWSDLGVTVGQRWAVRGDCLSEVDGSGIFIDLGTPSIWQPKPPLKGLPDRQKVVRGIDCLRELAVFRAQRDGLLRLALDRHVEPAGATERAAVLPIRALSQEAAAWLDDDDLRIMKSLEDLLGLGPGLTPSGDDMIAGLLITAHYIGHGRAALDLWHRLAPLARHRTTKISLAHLSAAGEGVGAAPFHDLLDALIENRDDQLSKALDAVAKIGHCSGWDAVGGMLLLFNAWIRAGTSQSAAA